MYGAMDGGWMDEWMDGWMDGWVDRLIDRFIRMGEYIERLINRQTDG